MGLVLPGLNVGAPALPDGPHRSGMAVSGTHALMLALEDLSKVQVSASPT